MALSLTRDGFNSTKRDGGLEGCHPHSHFRKTDYARNENGKKKKEKKTEKHAYKGAREKEKKRKKYRII